MLDTHDMVVVHRAFRRESRLLAELIAEVREADTSRARILARHLRWYRTGLHNHHHGEDVLIWPLLRSRVTVQPDVVARMEDQHARIADTLDQVLTALPGWEHSAAACERERLVAALVEHRAVLIEHLDDEEVHLLPLAAQYLSQPEWDALGEHFVANTPKRQLVTFLGAVLEDADTNERATVLGALPTPARLIWRGIGRPIYRRRVRRIRSAGSASRSPARVSEHRTTG